MDRGTVDGFAKSWTRHTHTHTTQPAGWCPEHTHTHNLQGGVQKQQKQLPNKLYAFCQQQTVFVLLSIESLHSAGGIPVDGNGVILLSQEPFSVIAAP